MKTLTLLASMILFSIGFSQDATNESDEKSKTILDKLSKDIKALNSFKLDFSIQIKNPTTGEDTQEKGSGVVKGDKFTATLGQNEIISNGIKIWTVVKEEKVVYETEADEEDEESINPKRLMTIWETGFKSKYVGEETVDGKKVHVINLYPTNPGEVQYHTIILYINQQSNELHKAIMKTKDGTTMTYTINKFSKNIETTDSQFVYDPRKFVGFQLIRD